MVGKYLVKQSFILQDIIVLLDAARALSTTKLLILLLLIQLV